MSVGRAVEFRNVGNPQGPQQFGNGDPAGRVDRIDHDFESCLGDRPAVYGREGQYFFDVPVDAFQVGRDRAQTVYFGIRIVIGLCRAEDFGALFRIEKFSLAVEQFQGVPLLGVVAGGDDDASVGLMVDYHHFHGRGGGEPQVDHVDAHPGEGRGNQGVYHRSRDAGIAPHYDPKAVFPGIFFQKPGPVGGGEFYRVERGEVVVCPTSDGAPDAGNGFYQCHDFRCIMGSILWSAPSAGGWFPPPRSPGSGIGFRVQSSCPGCRSAGRDTAG